MMTFAGCVNRQQLQLIEYLQEENRALREMIGDRRLRFTDDHRRRLAAKAKRVGRKALQDIATIDTPDTLLRWHRDLIARKWDSCVCCFFGWLLLLVVFGLFFVLLVFVFLFLGFFCFF